MIRLILKTTYQHEHNGMSGESFHTFDIEHVELESILTSGGYGESYHESTKLIGSEVLPNDVSKD